MAGSFVIGVGAGVVLLFVLWAVVVLSWLQFPQFRMTMTLLALVVTGTLILIPTDDGRKKGPDPRMEPDLVKPQDAFQVYDYMFIWKGILMVMMTSSVLLALGVYLKEFWVQKTHGSKPVAALGKCDLSSNFQ